MYPQLEPAALPRVLELIERFTERKKRQLTTHRKAMRAIAQYAAHVSGSLSAPLTVSIDLTNACNQDCVFCYREGRTGLKESGDRNWMYRPLSDLQKILDSLSAMGVASVALTGGEPTAHPQWLEAVAAVKARGFATTLITNGTLLDESAVLALADLFDPASDVVELSLDAADAETYYTIRRSRRFNRLLATLASFRAHAIPFTTMTLLMQANHHQATDILRLASSHGARVTALEAPFPKRHITDLSIFAGPEEVLAAYAAVLEDPNLENQEIELNFLHFSIMTGTYESIRSALNATEQRIAGCHAGHTTCAIDIRNQVHLCPYLIATGATNAGSLDEASFEELWKTGQRMRSSVAAQCSSGCPAFDLDRGTKNQPTGTPMPSAMARQEFPLRRMTPC